MAWFRELDYLVRLSELKHLVSFKQQKYLVRFRELKHLVRLRETWFGKHTENNFSHVQILRVFPPKSFIYEITKCDCNMSNIHCDV